MAAFADTLLKHGRNSNACVMHRSRGISGFNIAGTGYCSINWTDVNWTAGSF